MSYVFDITENMQASVRFGTGCHPDGKSLGIYIHGPEELHDEGKRPRALDLNAYDAVDWERAVAFAKWILSFGEDERMTHDCGGCPECVVLFDEHGYYGSVPDSHSSFCKGCPLREGDL